MRMREINLLRKIHDDFRYLKETQKRKEHEQKCHNEWKQVALVVDRIFMFIYLIGMIATILIIVTQVTSWGKIRSKRHQRRCSRSFIVRQKLYPKAQGNRASKGNQNWRYCFRPKPKCRRFCFVCNKDYSSLCWVRFVGFVSKIPRMLLPLLMRVVIKISS